MTGVAAASGYYGSLIPGAADEQPKVPVILHFGRFDTGIPMEGSSRSSPRIGRWRRCMSMRRATGSIRTGARIITSPSADLAKARTLALFAANGAG